MKKLSELIPYFVGINDDNDNLGIEPIDRLVEGWSKAGTERSLDC